MARAYSLDLRERVVEAVLGGLSCAAAAERYSVSVSSALKWTRRKRETGSAAAAPMGGKRSKLLEAERDWLMARTADARSEDHFNNEIANLLKQIPPSECANYFRNTGSRSA